MRTLVSEELIQIPGGADELKNGVVVSLGAGTIAATTGATSYTVGELIVVAPVVGGATIALTGTIAFAGGYLIGKSLANAIGLGYTDPHPNSGDPAPGPAPF